MAESETDNEVDDHVIWIQPNKVNMKEMDCGRWNEWDGLWTKGNENGRWSMKSIMQHV